MLHSRVGKEQLILKLTRFATFSQAQERLLVGCLLFCFPIMLRSNEKTSPSPSPPLAPFSSGDVW